MRKLMQHQEAEPPSVRATREDVPEEIDQILRRMMAKKPEERFQTGREIVREAARLRDALVGLGGQPTAVLTMVNTGVAERLHIRSPA